MIDHGNQVTYGAVNRKRVRLGLISGAALFFRKRAHFLV
jgi:hypothetical protein